MKLTKLSVQRFQCIEAAELDFGPGLNVLYGPNDLGKSSLAWAIRAVLLLQHNSSQHERFVPWYGGGEPRVALTFTDAEDHYWRVTKVFGSAGRSSLETSRDGRSFTGDANGRQVDDKLRKLLGWGISAPGGKGGPRGIPDAFLIQVLLAEQANVRRVLLDSSLINDPDTSGRLRLTVALGALAQDPTFKQILDRAQAQRDRAFTSTGRPKTATTSPFVHIDAQIKDLEHEHEALETKVRDTGLAETKIRELHGRRDELELELRDARARLAGAEHRFAIQGRRAGLRAQIDRHRAALARATELHHAVAAEHHTHLELEHEAEAGDQRLRDATAAVAQREATRDAARRQLDDLTRGDGDTDRVRGALEDERRRIQGTLHEAQRSSERTGVALRQARDASAQLANALAGAGTAAAAAARTDEGDAAAARDVDRARRAVGEAEQRLREVTSEDRMQARELRRAELQNRQLTRRGERAEHAAIMQRAQALAHAVAAAAAAEASHAAALAGRDAVTRAVQAELARLAALDAEQAGLVAQDRLGQLRQARDALAAATRAAQDARQHRDRAVQLRGAAAATRAKVDPATPSRAGIAELRELRDRLRIAETRLAVGLAVVVRPLRPIALRAMTDDVDRPPAPVEQPVTLAAQRRIALRIDDLVDLEIHAGAEPARAEAIALQARWDAEGAAILRQLGIGSIEQLEQLRYDADASLRAADDQHREAELLDQRAEPLAATGTRGSELPARIAELEAELAAVELAAVDRAALAAALDRRGAGWQAAIKQSLAKLDPQRQHAATAADLARQQLARLDAQLEALGQAAAAVRSEATRQQGELPDASAAVARAGAAIHEIDRELAEVDHALALSAAGTGDEAALARANLQEAEAALARAEQARAAAQHHANQARDAAVQAATRVELARGQASALDLHGAWRDALGAGEPLAVDTWQQAAAGAEHHRLDVAAALVKLGTQLDDLARERAATVKRAGAALEGAEQAVRTARGATEALVARGGVVSHEIHRLQLEIANLNTRVAEANLDGARDAIADLQLQHDALGSDAEPVAPGDVETARAAVEQLEWRLRDAEQDQAKANGALEQVGGAIVRERQRELDGALQLARTREHEVRVEYEAWKLLAETMKETEAAEGAHLGRALAPPVSQRFRELTSGRYGSLELGPHLESNGIQVAGELRDLHALSAGTQDQLATLLRLCIAEQLRSSIVLDDHLSQSDPDRVTWFNAVLRTAASQIQIALFTCRPFEVLSTSELPADPEVAKVAAAGALRAVDLTRVIRRFAGSPAPAAERATGSRT
ncbi:MAG TPA: AAA family ATPase [Kofleriaceae bacterium]|nr:AAA family ATPase [Kofleriaceae bacterium]